MSIAFLMSAKPALNAIGSIDKPSALVPFLILAKPRYKKSLAIILLAGLLVKVSKELIATSILPFS